MNTIIEKDYQHLSQKAYEIVKEQIQTKPDSVICFPTGSTPQGMYQLLREDKSIDFSKVIILSVDEYYGLHKDDPNSYAHQLHRDLFNHVNLKNKNIHLMNGTHPNTDELLSQTDALIENHPIDLYIDGLGENGHIAFNEPASKLNLTTHLSPIDESTRQANSRFFNSIDDVPTHAITLGIQQILSAKHIMILANGPKKKEAVTRILKGQHLDPQFPASILHLHHHVTLIVDKLTQTL